MPVYIFAALTLALMPFTVYAEEKAKEASAEISLFDQAPAKEKSNEKPSEQTEEKAKSPALQEIKKKASQRTLFGSEDDEKAEEDKKAWERSKEEFFENDDNEDKGLLSFLNFIPGLKKDKKDKKEAIVLSAQNEFEKNLRMANSGDINAQLAVAYAYLSGNEFVKPDSKKAFRYYALAAGQSDSTALNNLGSMYYGGIGIDKDTLKAAQLFERAAHLGNPEAATNLDFLYLTGNGIRKDKEAAIDMFKLAAKGKNPAGMFMLGYAYYRGFVVRQDYDKAAELIREVADMEYDDAEYILSLMYIDGYGVPQNFGNAVKFLHRAADQGNINAMTMLGELLFYGSKYNKDLFTAHVMYNLAAVRGAKGGFEKRDLVASKMKIEEVLQAQANAERFVEKPSELTTYIHQTFGKNIMGYMDK